MKIFVAVVLIVILGCLGFAAVALVKTKEGEPSKVLTALTWRIGLSVCLFLFILFSYWMGWISPNSRPL
jgi:Protein of unknown function (DUF2909)